MRFRDIADFCLATYGLFQALDKFQQLEDRKKARKAEKRAKKRHHKKMIIVPNYTDYRR